MTAVYTTNAPEFLLGLGRKVEVEELAYLPELITQAEQWAAAYTGGFEFMIEMRRALLENGWLTAGQAKGVLNCWRADLMRNQRYQELEADRVVTPVKTAPATEPVLVEAPSQGVTPKVTAGIYTIYENPETGEHITVRLTDAKGKMGTEPGTQIASYLYGPDNDADYMGFAFVRGEKFNVWSRYKSEGRLSDALIVLLSMNDEGITKAGQAYAMRSGNCFRCGRTLTDPTSIELGVGPICRGDK